MSAKNKLRIALFILKEASIIEYDQQLNEQLKNLQMFLNDFQIQDDEEYEVQRMALGILNQTVKISLQRMNKYYKYLMLDDAQIQKSGMIAQIKNKQYQIQNFCQILQKILDQKNGQFYKQMNINTFLKKNDIKIKGQQ